MPVKFTRSRSRRSSSRRRACTRSRPAIGTAHGLYKSSPELRPERVTELVALHPIPMVLHGGTGLTESQFTDLIARGCAKVNISTALKIAFVESHREYLEANPGKHDPPSMLAPCARGRQGHGRPPHRHVRVGGTAPAPSRQPRPDDPPVPALIFDCDGVLADTERDGHRPAFNETFAEVGLPVRWSAQEYAREAQDRRRQGADGVAAHRRVRARDNGLPSDPEGQKALLADWHRRKTATLQGDRARPAGSPAVPASPGSSTRRWPRAGRWRSPRPRPRSRSGPCSSTPSATDAAAQLLGVRRRHRPRQEARSGDLPAGARPARRSSSLTRS